MHRVSAVVALLVSACYAPETRDCTVSCSADTDCVAGQRCTHDHFCAAESVEACADTPMGGTVPPDARSVADAGTPGPTVDAGMPPDARPPAPDAPPPPPSNVALRVAITGGGSVRVSAGAECDRGTCTYSVATGTAVTLTAVDHGRNKFDRWQTTPCAGQGAICRFTITADVTEAVLFSHGH